MRGYGDSDKPSGVDSYAMDLLVNDVKLIVEALGSYVQFIIHQVIQLPGMAE